MQQGPPAWWNVGGAQQHQQQQQQQDEQRPSVRVISTRTIQSHVAPASVTPAPAPAAASVPVSPPPAPDTRRIPAAPTVAQSTPLLPPVVQVRESKARMFSPLDDRVEIAGWPRDRTDALRLDGQFWKDPETKTERATPDDTYFGPDYLLEMRLRDFAKQQDLVYQFLEQFAFHTGQSTNMDQYWKGAAAGGRAVELIFPNVFTGKVGVRGPLDQSEQHTEVKKNLLDVSAFLGEKFNMLSGEEKKALMGSITDAALGKVAQDVQASEAADAGVDPSLLDPVASSSATGMGAGGSRGPDAKIAEEAEAKRVETLRKVMADPAYHLLKILNSDKANETRLKAWDLLFNDGKHFFPPKSTGEIDWKDPVQRKRALEAFNDISKMLTKGEGGLDWKNAPENSGLVFLTTTVKGAILHAHGKIQTMAKKQWVPLIDLMTHENVYREFAELAALFVSKVQSKYPSRYLNAGTPAEVTSEIGFALMQFKRLTRNAEGYLCFSNTYSASAEAERRAATMERRKFVERNGRYQSDRYAEAYGGQAPPVAAAAAGRRNGDGIPGVRSFQINKKPRTHDNLYHQRIAEEKDALMNMMGM